MNLNLFKNIPIGSVYTLKGDPTRYVKMHATVSYREDTRATVIHGLRDLVHVVGEDSNIYNNPDSYSHYICSLVEQRNVQNRMQRA